MGLFIWDEKYAVGEALIDSQHQGLFDLANKLVDSNNQGELTNNVMQLFCCVRQHFDHEQAVMKQAGYPGYLEHVAMHDSLVAQLSEISDDICNNRWQVSDLQKFMSRWLLGDIVEQDTKLARYISTKK